jgi:hypothetical protein
VSARAAAETLSADRGPPQLARHLAMSVARPTTCARITSHIYRDYIIHLGKARTVHDFILYNSRAVYAVVHSRLEYTLFFHP